MLSTHNSVPLGPCCGHPCSHGELRSPLAVGHERHLTQSMDTGGKGFPCLREAPACLHGKVPWEEHSTVPLLPPLMAPAETQSLRNRRAGAMPVVALPLGLTLVPSQPTVPLLPLPELCREREPSWETPSPLTRE